jgi:hypothetical protein
MKLFSKISSAPYALLAAVTVTITATVQEAQADGGKTLGAAADDVLGQVSNVGKLVVAGAFLIGVIMVAAGLMKLKQAADTQGQQVKYGEGLWRLAVGAGLVAVPALTGMLVATGGMTATDVTASGGWGASQ